MNKRIAILFSVLSGILLGFPWLNTSGFFLFVAFIPLLWVEKEFEKQGKRPRIFWSFSFLSMLVWNSITSWWIWNATPVGSIMAILVNSFLMSCVWYLFHRIKRIMGSRPGYLALIGIWISFEYLHLNWEISWPWLSLGSGFANDVKWVQWYEYTGILGGAVWIWLINCLILKIVCQGIRDQSLKNSRFIISQVLFLVLVPIIISYIIYNQYEEQGNPVEVVVVQPNIDPYSKKFDPKTQEWQTDVLLQLADSLTTENTSFVIGPETALHGIWENNIGNRYSSIRRIRNFLKKYPNVNFVVGASSYKWFTKGEKLTPTARKFRDGNGYYEAYNSAFLFDTTQLISKYHKSKLVVGVENMPFTRVAKFVEKMAIDLGGTTGSLGRQKERRNLVGSNGIKVAPGICYESIYGEFLGKYVLNGAQLIAIITNDGWWKNTPGYRQHLSFSRLRAIETRKSIARSANTGISALINQRGDILQQTGWWEPAVLRGELKANSRLTFYCVWGDFIGRIFAFLSLLIFIAAITRSVKNMTRA